MTPSYAFAFGISPARSFSILSRFISLYRRKAQCVANKVVFTRWLPSNPALSTWSAFVMRITLALFIYLRRTRGSAMLILFAAKSRCILRGEWSYSPRNVRHGKFNPKKSILDEKKIFSSYYYITLFAVFNLIVQCDILSVHNCMPV
jgi:hypothetical protein